MTVRLTPSRPYLVRALHEWLVDNQCTPYLLVDASLQGVVVPEDFVSEGQIILNISPNAVKDLFIDDKGLSFNARFGGVPMAVFVPTVAILAVYAKENGQGMVFGTEPGAPDPEDYQPPEPPKPTKSKSDKPFLKVVK